jgi:hypothetical protein
VWQICHTCVADLPQCFFFFLPFIDVVGQTYGYTCKGNGLLNFTITFTNNSMIEFLLFFSLSTFFRGVCGCVVLNIYHYIYYIRSSY